MSPQELVTVEEAAAQYGLHRTTLFRYIAEGKLSRKRWLGDRKTYLSRSELQRLVDSPTVTRCLELVYEPFRTTGEWPSASQLQRQLVQHHDDFDLLAALEALPPDLGWRMRDTEGRAQLTLRGIARCEKSADDVNAFVSVIRICHERYISDDENLVVTSAEVREALGFDELMLGKLFKVFEVESGFWNGLGRSPDGVWTVTIDGDRIRHFGGVASLSDYLAAKERAFQPGVAMRVPGYGVMAAEAVPPSTDWHPEIADAVGDLLDADNPTPAVLAAATAFERLVARRVGTDKRYGRDLVGTFFELAQRAAPPDPRRVESIKSIALGALGAFRNPAAHGRLDVQGFYAREVVTLFSLLSREVDALPFPLPPTSAARPA